MAYNSSTVSEIDLPELLDRVGGDCELLREIITIFLDECPALVNEIRSAISRSDNGLLERSAHSLKGSVSNFGAQSATAAAYALEVLGRQHKVASAAGELQKLEAELSFVVPALQELLTQI